MESLPFEESISNQNENKEILEIQQKLLNMGFELSMINKAFQFSNKKTIEDLILFLTKENGKWNHPFIPEEKEEHPFSKSHFVNNNKPINLIEKLNPIIEMSKSNIFSIKERCDICGDIEDNHHSFPVYSNNIILKEDDSFSNHSLPVINLNFHIEENCGICLSELDDPIQLEKCGHFFCRECFKQYINELIKINKINQISCPNYGECNNNELSEKFFLTLLDKEYIDKYYKFKSQNEIEKDPSKMFCPFCESYAILPGGNLRKSFLENSQLEKQTITCIKNKHNFCICGRAIHKGKCYKASEDVIKYLKKEKIKKCPKCGFLIKKNEGCNHMTCGNPNCGYEFCWICMNETNPGHYEMGPCAGMQFVHESRIEEERIERNRKNEYPIWSVIIKCFGHFCYFHDVFPGFCPSCYFLYFYLCEKDAFLISFAKTIKLWFIILFVHFVNLLFIALIAAPLATIVMATLFFILLFSECCYSIILQCNSVYWRNPDIGFSLFNDSDIDDTNI